MAQVSQKRKRGWLYNYDQHHVRDCQSKEEEGLAGKQEEESQYLIVLAPSNWLKFPFMNTGEYIIVYARLSLTVALCSPLSTCSVLALLWCFCLPAVIRSVFCVCFALFCVLCRFCSLVSVISFWIPLARWQRGGYNQPRSLIQIRRHLWRFSYASHHPIIQVIVWGPFPWAVDMACCTLL